MRYNQNILKLRLHKTIFSFIFLLLIVFVLSCSTKKNTFVSRNFHHLTARYNAYFNGKESLKEGIRICGEVKTNDFKDILPVFSFPDQSTAQSIFPQCDRAITKSAIVVSKHSIFIKGKEFNPWIDNTYLLMGKANFYKKEYFTANQIFQFIIRQYEQSDSKYEAMLWLANSYIQMQKYDKAEKVIASFNDNKSINEVPSYLKKWVLLTKGELLIKTKSYNLAIEALEEAMRIDKKELPFSNHRFKEHLFFTYKLSKKQRIRTTFIIAQLYKEMEENMKASEYFEKVVQLNPSYEMAFYSTITRAKLFNVNGKDSKKIKDALAKMLKDRKNADYRDQIYYALAEIALKENNKDLAISYLQKSTAASISNTQQKAESFLRLAEIFFKEPNYSLSQINYDSCVQFLDNKYPNYPEIARRSEILNNLVSHINTIELQDSLLSLSFKSKDEINEIIDNIIKKIIEKEELEKMQELQSQQLTNTMQQTNTNIAASATGEWYFDNASAINLGKKEFAKKWNGRKNEDNWRRKNKEASMDFGLEEETAKNENDSTEISKVSADPKNPQTYLSQIPFSPKDKEISHQLISEAYFNAGIIFSDDLQDYQKGNEFFDKLLTLYPNTTNKAETYFRFYLNYSLLKNKNKSDYYKDLLLKNYPNSEFAKIILDKKTSNTPQYNDKVGQLYYDTYLAYQNKNYPIVFKNSALADSLYKNNALSAKFAYIKALTIGKTQDTSQFKKALANIVAQFDKEPEAAEAQIILNYFNSQTTSSTLSDNKKMESIYNYDNKKQHLFIALIPIKNVNINNLKIAITDFNNLYYNLDKLSIGSFYFDNENQLLSVTSFKNIQAANAYLDFILAQKIIESKINTPVKCFIISDENYLKLFNSKNLKAYEEFYENNYK